MLHQVSDVIVVQGHTAKSKQWMDGQRLPGAARASGAHGLSKEKAVGHVDLINSSVQRGPWGLRGGLAYVARRLSLPARRCLHSHRVIREPTRKCNPSKIPSRHTHRDRTEGTKGLCGEASGERQVKDLLSEH